MATTEPTIKDQLTGKIVIQGYMDGNTLSETASKMGLTRGGIYARLKKAEVQEVMTHEVRGLETKLQSWIEELHDSPSPANQRHATSELGKIVKHVQDKVYPSIFRTENININIDLDPYKEREYLHQEIISRMPPTMRTLYKEIEQQIKQEQKP